MFILILILALGAITFAYIGVEYSKDLYSDDKVEVVGLYSAVVISAVLMILFFVKGY